MHKIQRHCGGLTDPDTSGIPQCGSMTMVQYVQTYVPWNLHEPSPGKYNWEGYADINGFLQVAADVGLNVLLRAGPYICGEWDFGGLPWWLAFPGVSAFLDSITKECHMGRAATAEEAELVLLWRQYTI